jgi:hypothetical protein
MELCVVCDNAIEVLELENKNDKIWLASNEWLTYFNIDDDENTSTIHVVTIRNITSSFKMHGIVA